MIKLRKRKEGYLLDCPPNWYMALTNSELFALWLLLKKHYNVKLGKKL